MNENAGHVAVESLLCKLSGMPYPAFSFRIFIDLLQKQLDGSNLSVLLCLLLCTCKQDKKITILSQNFRFMSVNKIKNNFISDVIRVFSFILTSLL